jgi:hypothetical protein
VDIPADGEALILFVNINGSMRNVGVLNYISEKPLTRIDLNIASLFYRIKALLAMYLWNGSSTPVCINFNFSLRVLPKKIQWLMLTGGQMHLPIFSLDTSDYNR